MDSVQLRDEAVRDRIRAAEEFLDPSKIENGITSRYEGLTLTKYPRRPSRSLISRRCPSHAQQRPAPPRRLNR